MKSGAFAPGGGCDRFQRSILRKRDGLAIIIPNKKIFLERSGREPSVNILFYFSTLKVAETLALKNDSTPVRTQRSSRWMGVHTLFGLF